MSKNKEMLNIFFKVLKNNKKAINLVMPNHYVKSIYDINYDELLKKNITNIIFDIDNTILPVNDITVSGELIDFINELKNKFNICILSNNNEARVNPVKEKLKVQGFANAKKPSKYAYDKALNLLNSSSDNTVMVGDQMLSDIVFANKYKLNELDINMTDYDVLEIIGRKRGCIVSGGEVDMEKAAKCFLEDFKNGKIGKMTLDVLA